MELKERAGAVRRKLLDYYGFPEWRAPLPAMDELISTILSQNTNDGNRDRAFAALRTRFPTWEQVRDADPQEVIQAIRSAGLANQKGPRIQKLLQEITARCGELSLDFLSEMELADARQWLLQFKGVGPKTAAIVLLFSLGRPAFPVDTHIYRVTGRIGLRPMTMNVEKAHAHLESLLPEESYYDVHLNLIRLGREVCHPRRPECPACPVRELCDYYAHQYQLPEEQQK